MDPAKELLGQAIARVDNIMHALNLGVAPAIHVEQMKALLPEIVKDLKAGFVGVTGENPWG